MKKTFLSSENIDGISLSNSHMSRLDAAERGIKFEVTDGVDTRGTNIQDI